MLNSGDTKLGKLNSIEILEGLTLTKRASCVMAVQFGKYVYILPYFGDKSIVWVIVCGSLFLCFPTT